MQAKDASMLLNRLAAQEWEAVERKISQASDITATSILIGACQAFDYWLLNEHFSQKPEAKLSVPDMSIVSRGWNPLLRILLGRVGKQSGIPISSVEWPHIQISTALLHQLGRSVILRKTAELIERGNFFASVEDREVSVSMVLPRENDLFSDRIDEFRWRDLELHNERRELEQSVLSPWRRKEIQEMMDLVVYPYEMPHGKIVGYSTTLEIDEHFMSLVLPEITNWQRQSGLFPQARLKGISGADIVSVLSLIMSSRLSHSQLVVAGKRKFSDVNYFLANTVWSPKSEIVSGVSSFLKLDPIVVSTIIDRSTYGVSPSVDLTSDVAPLCPPFIKVSREYLLRPMSFLFSNPLETFKRLNDDPATRNAVRIHREEQMAEEINSVFAGDRFRCLKGRARLKSNGKVVTDIDAAILDVISGEVGLFQLKWQDFHGANNRQQISRSRNFVDQVDEWSAKVHAWIASEGTKKLMMSLQLPSLEIEAEKIYLFAVGQQAARFSSFGFPRRSVRTAPATMNQFMRNRIELGVVQKPISDLFAKIQSEVRSTPILEPIPYSMKTGDYSVNFENMWNSFPEDKL